MSLRLMLFKMCDCVRGGGGWGHTCVYGCLREGVYVVPAKPFHDRLGSTNNEPCSS
jgi:hypothetical protein